MRRGRWRAQRLCRCRTRPRRPRLLGELEAYLLETCILRTLRRGHLGAPLRDSSGNGREKNLKQASKDVFAPWRALVPAADSHSYNKHIQSFKELTCPRPTKTPSGKKPVRPTLHTHGTASGRVRRLDRVPRDHVAPGTPRRPGTYTVSGTLQPIRLSQ